MKLENEIIRPQQLVKQLNISKSTLFRLRANPEFPKAISLGTRSIGFFAKDIDNWLISRKERT
ncbi:helix-turn-helix transcriptional regulator [Pseudoalteromonas sp. SYSU M81236]|uniref:helix-turn-helix transcriptional regulator n=1 Tax=Pseudoalteromonas sp. SYSU M81236 TaxID=3447014 RepID=UPI003F0720FB